MYSTVLINCLRSSEVQWTTWTEVPARHRRPCTVQASNNKIKRCININSRKNIPLSK